MKRQSERSEQSPGRAKRARERREEASGTHHKSSGRRERPNQAGTSSSSSSSSSSRRPRDPPPRPLLLPTPGETTGLEYKTLLISNLGSALPDPLLEDWLFRHFQRFGEISVKLSHTPELGRVAYINFRRPGEARQARHAKLRPVLYDRPLRVEPVFTQQPTRRPEPTPLPLTTLPAYPRSTSPRHLLLPPALTSTTTTADSYYSLYEERARGATYGMSSTSTADDEQLAPEDDHRATRNLFIGNLDHAVSEVDLRRAFDKYGPIEEVVIKRPARNQGSAYAFLKFQNLDMAHRAKLAMSGRLLGRNAMKIGYGKANPSTRLWVGGLGPSTSLAALAREFDRFGSIRTVDYVKGDSFAYIQYESLDAAQAACAQMRGFALGDRRLRVDFAKVTPEEAAAAASRYAPLQPTPYPLPLPYELLQSEAYSRHRPTLEPDLRVRDRTPPHLLYSDRERPFVEASWVNSERRSSGPGARSRSGDRGGGGSSKTREERRRRRSLSGERGRSRTERSPDRPRREASERDPGTPPSPQHNHRPPPQDKPRPPTPEPPQPRRNHHPRPPEPPEDRQSPVPEKGRTLPPVWCGHLVLKNSCFPTYLHFLEGDRDVPSALLRDRSANNGGSLAQLKIAQRLRLDQPKLEEVTRRVKQGTSGGFAVLLAIQAPQTEGVIPEEPGLQRRLLRNLVSYLKQKQAAGVISLPVGGSNKGRDPSGMLYAFPPCDFHQLYQQSAQRTVGKLEENMIIVLVKDGA
ncbi:putative RNA-binding protein 15B [Spea bombifrons]|uniref:putative RNA-binding protein 15B n=1 Tax=Spea bombifrons TaxID=233779 RepID=UPI00234B3E9C|nr:putative RNA-binding protein 15B [Spea bombifrons]